MSTLTVRRLKPTERRWLDMRPAERTLSAYVLDRYRIIEAILQGFRPTEVSRILSARSVRVDGTGVPTGPLAFVSAWIELYEKEQGQWRLIGNVSNFRPDRQ